MPKLSIVTINYNNCSGLSKTIASVGGQTFADKEFIIIDGGSTDGSADVIKANGSLISHWVSEKDTGIYNAMNKGIAKAKGEYLLFLNSGDRLVSNNTLHRVFENFSSHDIVYGDLIIDDNGNEKHGKMPEILTQMHLLKDTLWHPVSFIKKSLFERYGQYNEAYKIVGDYEFFLRVIVGKKVKARHISIEIAVFENNGISNKPEYKEKLIAERKLAQDQYFSWWLLLLFRTYSKLAN